jgi:hypothetical protein
MGGGGDGRRVGGRRVGGSRVGGIRVGGRRVGGRRVGGRRVGGRRVGGRRVGGRRVGGRRVGGSRLGCVVQLSAHGAGGGVGVATRVSGCGRVVRPRSRAFTRVSGLACAGGVRA